jgi:molybdenum ABC transporter molybdate-binding protein
MPTFRRHFGFLSHAGLLASLSAGLLVLLGVLLWSPWDQPTTAGGASLRFYCAAGMSRPVAEILQAYQETYGGSVQVTYDSSGKLLSTLRIVRGQGDLYLAADANHMARARREGLVAEVIPVAVLRPVLIVSSRTQRQLRERGKPVTSVTDLLRDDLKVVLANPELTSIGQLSREVLARPGLAIWPRLEKHLRSRSARVSAFDTVSEVAQAVRTIPGSVGIVWNVVATQFPDLEAVAAPELAGVSETLQIGVLARSSNPTAALHLARYLTARDRGLAVLKKHGCEPVPDADEWADRPKIHLAAGAMLRPGLEDILKAFSEREGVDIDTSYNGCGLLVAQMRSIKKGTQPGRFPDAYFACDVEFLEQVQTWFDAAATISKNDMVLIVPRGNPKGVRSLEDLTRKDLRVGLPHPTHSALGKLTDDVLRKLRLHSRVHAADYADAAHLLVNQMRAGALDLAVVFRSNAWSAPAGGRDLEVIDVSLPEALATQPFAIARDCPHKYLLRRLLQAIVSRPSAQRFRSLGFRWAYESK